MCLESLKRANVRREKMLMRRFCLLVLSGILCLVVGIALMGFSRPVAVRAAEQTFTIEMTGIDNPSGFLPALLTVHVNDTIVFVNKAVPVATYSVVANDQSFVSPPIAPGAQWSTTFTAPGVHEYTDPAFASQLFGELVVVPGSVELLPTAQPGAAQTVVAQDQAALTGLPASAAAVAPDQGIPAWLLVVVLGVALVVVGLLLVLVLRRTRRRQPVSSKNGRRR
jgi:plastocyanin